MNEVAAAVFDNVDNDVLDGCGFDGNALIPAKEIGGVAEQPRRRFAQPKTEAEIDKARKESKAIKRPEKTPPIV